MKNEEQAIEAKFQDLIETCRQRNIVSKQDEVDIYRAFTIARNAHQGSLRKSGEPYIFHPLAVAKIAVKEVGLGPIAVICALLHDVVEDTDITLDQLSATFGSRVAKIVDGVTKITAVTRLTEKQAEGLETDLPAETSSLQAENYRKILLAMCDDVYVIFLKLCDRLHNMRTLGSMLETKRLAIASETQYLYIPLAHRLGLYKIKTELEDLVMKYTNPSQYADIEKKIKQASELAPKLEECFFQPIKHALDAEGYHYAIKTRIKSVYSCYKKMQNKGVVFDEIYDFFAMRIILDVKQENEKEECFKVYATVSKLFKPNPSRFRDWITTPKNNGYESLHTTVMSPIGRWVEVQIRSQRMDEIAEKGMAAHFLYKEAHPEEKIEGNPVEEWLQQLRTTLENSSKNALDLVEEFKETLTMRNIFVFTPKGETVVLPAHATVLDFAYAIHSHVGNTCMGAKVNSQVVPIQHTLHSGDQVQIITSRTTRPSEQWLKIAITTKAKEYIKDQLRVQKRQHEANGKRKLTEIFAKLHRTNDASTRGQCLRYFNLRSTLDLYYKVDIGGLGELDFKQAFGLAKKSPHMLFLEPYRNVFEANEAKQGQTIDPLAETTIFSQIDAKKDCKSDEELEKQLKADMMWESKEHPFPFLLEKEYEHIETHPASCCKPVQGDDVIGFLENGEIEVHRSNCPIAMHKMSIHKERIIRTRWRLGEKVTFLTGIAVTGFDRKGLLQEMTGIISNEMNLNMRAITLEASEGVARGIIMLYVHDLDGCNRLIQRLKDIDGIEEAKRI
ncbi:MAG: RelA/SpoT family protein [Bacteroidales bacterium]|nr:RelA/SpoT family protein [Bacteroidales bacterium]